MFLAIVTTSGQLKDFVTTSVGRSMVHVNKNSNIFNNAVIVLF